MGQEPNNYWLIAVGKQSYFWDICKENNFIVIGWHQFGNLINYESKEELKIVPESGHVRSQVWDFSNNMQIGDIVFVKRGNKTIIGMGRIKSDYYYDPDKIPLETKKDYSKIDKGVVNDPEHAFPNIRDVEWIQDFSPEGIDIPKGNWSRTLKKLNDDEINRIHNAIKGKSILSDKSEYANDLLSKKKQVIFYGPPGTGKTFNTKSIAVNLINKSG